MSRVEDLYAYFEGLRARNTRLTELYLAAFDAYGRRHQDDEDDTGLVDLFMTYAEQRVAEEDEDFLDEVVANWANSQATRWCDRLDTLTREAFNLERQQVRSLFEGSTANHERLLYEELLTLAETWEGWR